MDGWVTEVVVVVLVVVVVVVVAVMMDGSGAVSLTHLQPLLGLDPTIQERGDVKEEEEEEEAAVSVPFPLGDRI
ncbi:hypothetical protein E2C01_080783 [Portunus trituberculatus]|uniref:Uncharacterized protein n=1 Tax=Portunus trituberculatus TaxID=210409 RepID=A0A5B7IU33_PORTR|nr:hypothetical protein [Portunus trituberculatus]